MEGYEENGISFKFIERSVGSVKGSVKGASKVGFAEGPFEEPCATSNAHVPISALDFFLESVKAY